MTQQTKLCQETEKSHANISQCDTITLTHTTIKNDIRLEDLGVEITIDSILTADGSTLYNPQIKAILQTLSASKDVEKFIEEASSNAKTDLSQDNKTLNAQESKIETSTTNWPTFVKCYIAIIIALGITITYINKKT